MQIPSSSMATTTQVDNCALVCEPGGIKSSALWAHVEGLSSMADLTKHHLCFHKCCCVFKKTMWFTILDVSSHY